MILTLNAEAAGVKKEIAPRLGPFAVKEMVHRLIFR